MSDNVGHIVQLSNAPREPSPMAAGLATSQVIPLQEFRAVQKACERFRAAFKEIHEGYGPNHGSKFCRDTAANALGVQPEGSES